MIAVTGATGTIGSHLVRLLTEAADSVRALSRNPAANEEHEGVTWIRADLADRAALPAAQLEIASYQRAGGPTERVTDTIEELTGRPPRSFVEFARDHEERLRSSATGAPENPSDG